MAASAKKLKKLGGRYDEVRAIYTTDLFRVGLLPLGDLVPRPAGAMQQLGGHVVGERRQPAGGVEAEV